MTIIYHHILISLLCKAQYVIWQLYEAHALPYLVTGTLEHATHYL